MLFINYYHAANDQILQVLLIDGNDELGTHQMGNSKLGKMLKFPPEGENVKVVEIVTNWQHLNQ